MTQHRIIRGLAALAALAGLVAGVPLALIALAGNPLPSSFGELAEAFTTPDLGGAFLMGTVVPLLAWLAWAYLAVCVGLEAAAFATDWRSAVRDRAQRGPGRRFAASLLTAIVVMVGGSAIVGPAHAAEAAAPVSDAAAHADFGDWGELAGAASAASPGLGGQEPAHVTPPPGTATTPSEPLTVTVHEGDSLWSIADAYLGDGARYPEIVELNAGVPQDDGDALSDDLWVTPGWRLTLPPDATTTANGAGAYDANDPETRTEPDTGATPGTAAGVPGGEEAVPDQVIVEDGDTLWDLAETYLGDGQRYDHLASASGIADPSTILPGDVIEVAAAARNGGGQDEPGHDGGGSDAPADDADGGGADGSGAGSGSAGSGSAGSGDEADDGLGGDAVGSGAGSSDAAGGDGAESDAAGDEATGDGAHGGSTVVPAQPVDVSPAPTEEPTTPPPSTAGAGDETAGAAGASTGTSPGATTGATPPPAADGPAVSATGAGGDQAGAQVEVDESADGVNLQTIGGIGGVLAAGFLGWLGVRRALQRRRRRHGERIAMPEPELAAFETELRSVDTTTAVLHLDHAMRSLAAWAQDESSPMPPVAVVRVDADELIFYLDDPATLPPPFVAVTDDESAWALEAGQLEPLVREPSPPSPALVSVGNDASGAMVFVDLERLGIVTVDGAPELVRSALLAIAIELATSTWGDDTRLTLVGFDDALSEQLTSGRIRHVGTLAEVQTELAGHRRHVSQALRQLGADSPSMARTSSPDAESWSSEVVVLGEAVDGEALDQLVELALEEPRVGIAALVGGAVDDGWHIELRGPHEATLHLPGDAGSLELDPQLIAEPELDRLVELARVTSAPAHRAHAAYEETGDWTLTLSPNGTTGTGSPDDPVHTTPVDDATATNATAVAGSAADIDTDGPANDDAAIDDDAIDATAADIHADWVEIDSAKAETAIDAGGADPGQDLDATGQWHDAHVTHASQGTLVADDTDSALDAPPGRDPAGDDPAGHDPVGRNPSTHGPAGRDRPGRRRRASVRGLGDDLDEAARELLASLTTRPWVRLLGPVELLGAAGDPPVTPQTNTINNSTVKRATELVAYLALHPGATAEQFHAAFWPGKDPRGKTAASNRNGLATRARKWLGTTPEGEPYFPHVGSDGYRLHEQVTTDWHVFIELIGSDPTAASTPQLRAALDLVRGQPFAGVKERFYGWAEITRMDMLATIADTCHELAARALAQGDIGAARTTAALGREIDPINELAWRDALQAELLASDHAGFERIVSLLQQQLDDFEDGYEPEPETQDLIDRGRRRAHRAPKRDAALAS